MRRRAAAALVVPLSALMLGASSCGVIPEDWRTPAFLKSDEEQLDERLPTATGPVGEEPEVSFPDIDPPKEQISGVVHKGEGESELVRSDDMLLVDIVDYDWTGKGKTEKVQSTYETGAPMLLQLGQMTEELTADLIDQPVGSRVVYVFPPSDPTTGQPSEEGTTSVSVLDIRGRYGKGDVVPGEQTTDGGGDLPTAADAGRAMPDITIPDADPPKELETVELVEGEGPEVESGQQLVVQYTGVTWNDGEVFDSTWTRDGTPATFAIGVGQVIQGWDEGLVGQKVGSRVMLVIPEDLAYGENAEASGSPAGTLVFVVDILGAVDTQPAPEPSDQPEASAEPEASASPDGE